MRKLFTTMSIISTTFFVTCNLSMVKADVKIASFLGDSVTYGYTLPSQDYAYPAIFGEMTKMKINNYGVCCTTIATTRVENFVERYEEIDPQSNLIVVAGGSNDYGFSTPMGEIGSRDISTFHGALNVLMNNLQTKYPRATIIFMAPIKRGDFLYPNSLGYYLEAYRDAIVEEGAAHGILVLDLLSEPSLDFTNNWPETLPDGLHPNPECQREIAEYLYTRLYGN